MFFFLPSLPQLRPHGGLQWRGKNAVVGWAWYKVHFGLLYAVLCMYKTVTLRNDTSSIWCLL